MKVEGNLWEVVGMQTLSPTHVKLRPIEAERVRPPVAPKKQRRRVPLWAFVVAIVAAAACLAAAIVMTVQRNDAISDRNTAQAQVAVLQSQFNAAEAQLATERYMDRIRTGTGAVPVAAVGTMAGWQFSPTLPGIAAPKGPPSVKEARQIHESRRP